MVLVTLNLGFTAHVFLESDEEDGPFLPKGRSQKTVMAITEVQKP